jgi:hypothetical protein
VALVKVHSLSSVTVTLSEVSVAVIWRRDVDFFCRVSSGCRECLTKNTRLKTVADVSSPRPFLSSVILDKVFTEYFQNFVDYFTHEEVGSC